MEVDFFIKNMNYLGMVRMVRGKSPQDIDEAREFAEQDVIVKRDIS